jgi:aspartyl-tRNA(Asn)/glutamyl-tRNA(Gln) amidotransferase subunit B
MSATLERYEPAIGLEVHAQLLTRSKLFCACSTRFGDAPNTHVCPVCLGHPGILPVPNREAITLALRIGLAAGCDIREVSVWARKNYFYPDLPKGYQISQYDRPLCLGGRLRVKVEGETRVFRLQRIHLEEDAGKSKHGGAVDSGGATQTGGTGESGVGAGEIGGPGMSGVGPGETGVGAGVSGIGAGKSGRGPGQGDPRHGRESPGARGTGRDSDRPFSRVDLNRCGVPLVEIVGEPDLRSPAEAVAYLAALKQLLEYLEVCDGNMEEGSFRCDANVSVRPRGETTLGTRTELKNLNSFRFVERSLAFEIRRQSAILDAGGRVERATLLWDEAAGRTRVLRTKEEAQDYRYFPEPDLPPLVVSGEWIEEVRASMPELPAPKRARFAERYGLDEETISVLTQSRPLADYFEAVAATVGEPRLAANWIANELLGRLNQRGLPIERSPVTAEALSTLLGTIRSGALSGKLAKFALDEMVETGEDPGTVIAAHGWQVVSDDTAIQEIVDRVLGENPAALEAYRAGNEKLFHFFVGRAMRISRGQADPRRLQDLLKRSLEADS